jgi:hypothetical protein
VFFKASNVSKWVWSLVLTIVRQEERRGEAHLEAPMLRMRLFG